MTHRNIINNDSADNEGVMNENSKIVHQVSIADASDRSITGISSPLKRRKFLGLSLFGIAGLTIPSISSFANQVENRVKNSSFVRMFTGIEKSYWDRTDSFDVKKELLKSAWERKDFREVRALTNSIRISSIQDQHDRENPGIPISPSKDYKQVADMPAEWRNFAKGWNYYKVITLEERNSIYRELEPVELLLAFPSDKVQFLTRELRLAKLENGKLTETVSQVYSEQRRGEELYCKLLFLAECKANEKQSYLVFFGNPDAELPEYESDLKTSGEEFRLDVENNFYKVNLSRQNGKIQRLTIKRNHGLVLYPGGVGHGEPGNIDWSGDYMADGGHQKFRIALWDECPDYEIIKGPVCTIVRTWGFPYSPLHPLFSPARLNVDVEYRFYSGLPYFHKYCDMTAVKDFQVGAIRNDEWVLPGKILPEILWIGPDGKMNIGPVDKEYSEQLWGVGFFNKETSDSFIAMYLEHEAEGIPIKHTGEPRTGTTKFHGQVWARYPYRNGPMRENQNIFSKTAYLTLPFDEKEGPEKVENMRNELKSPLTVNSGEVSAKTKAIKSDQALARKGECSDSPIPKDLLWKALGNCKDPQMYYSDISIVELGLVYDIEVQGDAVNVVLAMPHRGRPLAAYFTHGSNSVQQGAGAGRSSLSIPDALLKVPGVKKVSMTQTWYPLWNSNLITKEGRKKLEI